MTDKEFREMIWRDWKILTAVPGGMSRYYTYDKFLSKKLANRFNTGTPCQPGRTNSRGPR